MKIVHAAALLLAAAACEAPAGPTPNYRPQEAGSVDHALCLLGFSAVPLRRTRGTGHHLVEATLNGRRGLFVLDTGANMSVLDSEHVAAFGLAGAASSPGGALGIGNRLNARQVSIQSLRLGPIRVRQRRMVITDLGQLTEALSPLAGGQVHGLIGQDVLNEHRAVIDVSRPLLYLIEADREPAPVRAERCRQATEQAKGKS
jgi:hypothetical protein